jgi:signal recognition particle subunit SRP54
MPAIQGIATEGGGRGTNGEKYQTPGLNQLPPALAGMNQLPEGFDPSALTFPGAGGSGNPGGGPGKKGSKKKRK